MLRNALTYLQSWKNKPSRKPLIIHGARQVGKSYLVREFAKVENLELLEINFERNPGYAEAFLNREPKDCIEVLRLQFNKELTSGKSLLFLDEIQAQPLVIGRLRYFYEELPELHICAAGSLLDFALTEEPFSVPVGRLEYMYLGPMTFEEFLFALGEEKLNNYINNYRMSETFPKEIHEKLLALTLQYSLIGGMPESVKTYVETASLNLVNEVKQALIATFRDDFHKYKGRTDLSRLHVVFSRIPQIVGRQVKYVLIDRDDTAANLSRTLDLLCRARIAYRVRESLSNGVPLGAEASDRQFKLLFLDIGIMSSLLGLNIQTLLPKHEFELANDGSLAEQFIGQHLLYMEEPYLPPELYYWSRDKKGSSAEVDYIIASGNQVVPIEVKAGKTGKLRSIHVFLSEKKRMLAVRFNSALSEITEIKKESSNAKLLSLPHYMVGQVRRLIREAW